MESYVHNGCVGIGLSQQHLEHFKKDKMDFTCGFITMDKLGLSPWSRIKTRDKEWCDPSDSASKRAHVQKSAMKLTFFWDAKGILFVDYFQTGKKILQPFRSVEGKKVNSLHEDNAQCHKRFQSMALKAYFADHLDSHFRDAINRLSKSLEIREIVGNWSWRCSGDCTVF